MLNHKTINIQQLSKKVGDKQLLQPLNYQLDKGNILAICGGNGAGKSTLLRLIAGLLKPTTGSIILNGLSNHTNKRDYSHQFGYMPDDFQFQKSLTAKETIQFYASIKNISTQEYEEKLKSVGLIDKLNEKVGTFSKGMKQRLLLTQALLANPKILILDEPTNGLDPYWVNEFGNLMVQAKANGQTIIFTTHDLYIVEKIANEIIFLHNGKVISSGSINDYNDLGLIQTFQQLYFN